MMDELITKRQAIERMNDLMVIELKMTRPPTWNEVYNAIEELPSAQRWIPCNERMPEAEEKVWIQTSRGKVCFAMYEDGTVLESESTWTWYDIDWARWDDEEDCGVIPEGWWEFTQFHPDCEFDCPVDEKVVAWMKLPELYKEDDNDKV